MLDIGLTQYCVVCENPTTGKCPRCKKPLCNKNDSLSLILNGGHDVSECAVPISAIKKQRKEIERGTPGPFIEMGNFPK